MSNTSLSPDWIERGRRRAPINLLRDPITDVEQANNLWSFLWDVVEAADYQNRVYGGDTSVTQIAAVAALRAEVERDA